MTPARSRAKNLNNEFNENNLDTGQPRFNSAYGLALSQHHFYILDQLSIIMIRLKNIYFKDINGKLKNLNNIL